jgi:PhzF family phenazine biosynthesis protein
MLLTIYQVDAFADQRFAGNPAAVVPLESWLPDATMQAIAAENNLSETAFIVPEPAESVAQYHIRWFTPTVEVALCGHATLGTAFVIFRYLNPEWSEVAFQSKSGILTVKMRDDALLELDFPADPPMMCDMLDGLSEALGAMPLQVLRGKTDILVRLENEATVRHLQPDFALLGSIKARGVIVTAKCDNPEIDFVSRFFGPQSGVNEDPVTGSAHCILVPYWAEQLEKTQFHAQQISARGGDLWCELQAERVKIAGKAVTYLEGKIWV